jgi:hypothetical protein
MKPISQKWRLEVQDPIPMPFSVLEADLASAIVALPVVSHRSTPPAFAGRSENALHTGDIIGEAMRRISALLS